MGMEKQIREVVEAGNSDMTAQEKEELRVKWLEFLYCRIEADLSALIQAETAKGSLMNPHHVWRLATIKGRLRDTKKWRNADY